MATRPQQHKARTTTRHAVKSTWRKSSDLYRTPRWVKFSKAFRAVNRVCAVDGCGKPSQSVDHVNGWQTEAEFWAGPFRALCWACHQAKSLRTRWDRANKRGGE